VQIPYLIGILIAGPLAEFWNVSSVLILAGLGGTLVFALGYTSSAVHDVESLLPDLQNLPE
jgi:hypothetical protein